MSTYSSTKVFSCDPAHIPTIAVDLVRRFQSEGYEVKYDEMLTGADISIRKGGAFKSVLGLKTALKVKITGYSNSIKVEAGVGVFGQQVVPTMIALFVAWPVALTTIWGSVKQAKLDNKAIDYVGEAIAALSSRSFTARQSSGFCGNCGERIPKGAKFCASCGQRA